VHPSLLAFTKETGIKVNYKEAIEDNDSFLGKINPSLQAGQDPGWDLIVITDGGSIEKLIRQNFLTELDHSKLPNFAKNAGPAVRNPSYDPGNKYTLAWQSGLVGLAYNPKLTKREITSFQDLFDPAFKGKITVFGDDWKKAAEWMKKLKPQLREFVDNSGMADVLSSGNAWISQAYSGDIYQLNIGGSPDIKFVIPKEGATYWTDNMAIPKNAKHPVDAITYMDYVYRPEVAAQLVEGIAYITPVPAAKEQLQAKAAKASGEDKAYLDDLVTNPLIFPTDDDLKNVKRYRALTVEEEQVWDSIFQPIVQS
jgi:spermidine/putrescine transport system substrate-binding protein